jgi:hypothetical protein
METALTEIVHTSQPMEIVDQVLEFWEEDDAGLSRRQQWIDELESFRATKSQEDVDRLARILYLTMIAFGEELPDMKWVHVAVICDELLRLGVPAWQPTSSPPSE